MADLGCSLTLANTKWLTTLRPNLELRTKATLVSVRGISTERHKSDTYVLFPFYLRGVSQDSSTKLAHFVREVHLIDDFQYNFLIGVNVLGPKRIDLLVSSATLRIGACENLSVPMNVRLRPLPVRHKVKLAEHTTLAPRQTQELRVQYLDLPYGTYIFDPASAPCALYAGLALEDLQFVVARNDSDFPVVIPIGTVLEIGRAHV